MQSVELEAIDAVCGSFTVDAGTYATHAEEILARFEEVDARLVAAGFPPTSKWWRKTIRRWYESGKRQLTGRIGRRGGKSSTLSRLAVVEALYGHHKVPPGDVGMVALVSTDRPEATERLRTIGVILDTLGIRYVENKAERRIDLVGRNRAFRVYTASIKGVSGFTAIFVLCDEVAKWRDDDTGTNPATIVLESIRPTMATQREARIVLSSSPMGRLDAHYDAFEEGETDLQIVAWAPTWLAHPELTEAMTRALEPDPLAHAREYGAIPQAQAETSLIPEVLIDRNVRRPPQLWDVPFERGHHYVATMDPATRGNAWTLAVMTRDHDRCRRLVLVREWRPVAGHPLKPGAVFAEIAELLAPYGIRVLLSDQWSEDALAEIALGYGISLVTDQGWTTVAKRDAYEAVRSGLQQGTLELHPDPQVRIDLLGIRKRFTRNGVTYELAEQKGRHSDYAPAIAMAAVQALAAASPDEQHLDESGKAKRAKHEFLLERERQKKRERRVGRLPVTHRRMG